MQTLPEIIKKYREELEFGYSCSHYGGNFDFYIADQLGIEPRTPEFRDMCDKWTRFLWCNDKNNIEKTLKDFINTWELLKYYRV